MGNQIASVKIGERGAGHRRVIPKHLNQNAQLRDTLRIPNHARYCRPLSGSNSHCSGNEQ